MDAILRKLERKMVFAIVKLKPSGTNVGFFQRKVETNWNERLFFSKVKLKLTGTNVGFFQRKVKTNWNKRWIFPTLLKPRKCVVSLCLLIIDIRN